jgi:hypothetical protein
MDRRTRSGSTTEERLVLILRPYLCSLSRLMSTVMVTKSMSSDSSKGPREDAPYVPSWCYPLGSPKMCPLRSSQGLSRRFWVPAGDAVPMRWPPGRLPHANGGHVTKPKAPPELDAISDVVLAYHPKPKSKPARKRKRKAAKLAKEK